MDAVERLRLLAQVRWDEAETELLLNRTTITTFDCLPDNDDDDDVDIDLTEFSQ